MHISFGTPSAFSTVTIYRVWRALELASASVGIFGGYIYCENSALKSCWSLVPDSFQSVQSHPPKWVCGPVEIHEWRKFVESVDAEHSRQASSSAGICSSGFVLLARCFAMKPDDFANRSATISRYPVYPKRKTLLHRTFREHVCDAMNSRLIRTSMNLECVTKWVDIHATQHQT